MTADRKKPARPSVTDDMEATLINASAAAADLLSHYQELIAKEGYLNTARERSSVAGRKKIATDLRRRLESLKALLDQIESVTSGRRSG